MSTKTRAVRLAGVAPKAAATAKVDSWIFQSAEELCRQSASEAALLEGLNNLRRAYVRLMENGRDRITMLGGECDPVDKMEERDPNLIEARDLIARTKDARK